MNNFSAQHLGVLMAISVLIVSCFSGTLIKAAGSNLTALVVSNFLVAGGVAAIVLFFWVRLQKNTMPKPEVWSRLWRVFALRCIVGVAHTTLACATYGSCLSFGPALLSTNALWLVLGGCCIPALRKGNNRQQQLIGALVATAGILVGSWAAAASTGKGACTLSSLGLALLGGLLFAVVAVLQQQLSELPLVINAAGHCVAAGVGVGGWAWATHYPVTFPWDGVVIGVCYVVLQVASQLANEWSPVGNGLLGLLQMPILTTITVIFFGQHQPGGVWGGVVLVMFGLGLTIVAKKPDAATKR